MRFVYLFLYTAFLVLILPLFFPYQHILYFAPFLVLCFYRYSLIGCLWWSILCGFFVDLFSADTRIGVYALNYSITTYLLYRFKMNLFEEHVRTLPVLTSAYACLSMGIQGIIFFTIGKSITIAHGWFVNDLLVIPLQSAIYSFAAFSVPLLIGTNLKRRYILYRLTKRRS